MTPGFLLSPKERETYFRDGFSLAMLEIVSPGTLTIRALVDSVENRLRIIEVNRRQGLWEAFASGELLTRFADFLQGDLLARKRAERSLEKAESIEVRLFTFPDGDRAILTRWR